MWRLGVLAAALVPMAVSDVRHRTVPTYMIFLGYGISAACLMYGMASGSLAPPPDPGGTAAVIGAAMGLLMVWMGRRFAMIGEADGHVVVMVCLAAPWSGSLPVSLYGVAAGCAVAGAWQAMCNCARNLSDMTRGVQVPFDVDFFASHIKRRGERFTVASTDHAGLRVDGSGTVRTPSGRALFEPAYSRGQRVYGTVPLVPYIISGAYAVTLLAGAPWPPPI